MRYGMTMRANLRFFKNLFGLLGWKTLNDDDSGLGVVGKHGESLWFIGGAKDVANDYDGSGMNHLGIGAESQADVDAAAAQLTAKGVDLLFDTPRHRPDFAASAAETYYQIMFETPDRILLEFVYTGPKQA
jgi:catechol 2,3-dioxygenase-like lactoylglutathione lyase family enzyme